ncbi:MAG: hypothetical protein NZ927_02045 [Candidatus Calescibacterium sp.]|nr:hypothetical protein [Candidatus Calescibacterium sp.]
MQVFLVLTAIAFLNAENGSYPYELSQSNSQQAQKQEEKEDDSEEEEEEQEDIETIIQQLGEQEREQEEPSLPYSFAEEEEKVELLSMKGYYRARVFLYSGLPLPDGKNVRYIRPDFFQSRLRLDPSVNLSPSIRVLSQIDILDDIVWGEGARGFSTSGELICDTFNYGKNISKCDGISRVVAVKRLWGEVDSILTFPVKLKIGRQPVNFGLGAYLNDGNGFKNLWDDAHLGTTKDRIAITTKISDSFDFDIGIDILVSELSDDGLADYFIVPRFRTSRISLELYTNAQRSQKTELYYFLPYINWTPSYDFTFEIEGGIFTGNVDYIPVFQNFTRYSVFAWNIASRVKWETGLIRIIFDAGYSSGDDNPNDKDIKSIPMNPDFNIGFILYEDVLARHTANVVRDVEELSVGGADFFYSKGGVFGSYYFMPTIGLFPFESIGAYISTLFAFSNHIFLVDPRSGQQFFGREAKKGLSGVELDFGMRVGTESLEFGIQLGYLILGNALRSAVPSGAKNTFKTQFRFTWNF